MRSYELSSSTRFSFFKPNEDKTSFKTGLANSGFLDKVTPSSSAPARARCETKGERVVGIGAVGRYWTSARESLMLVRGLSGG